METENEEKQEFQKFTLDGDTYKTKLTNKWLSHKPYKENNPGEIKSFIPGTIVKVFVKEGQRVKEGEQLLILEAMKMNNLIISPFNGIVTKLNVTNGAKVANKQVLVEVKEEEEEIEKKKERKKKRKK